MVCYGGWVWEGLSTETKPGDEQGSRDGHIFKELDTGESYTRIAGSWHFINLGLSFIKATKSGKITTDANGFYHVVFNTQFIDENYSVALSTQDEGTTKIIAAYFKNILSNGFDIYTRNRNGVLEPNISVSWLATRNYNPEPPL